MRITIPDDIFFAMQLTPEQLVQELAVYFFHLEKLTLAQAAKLSQMSRIDFQKLLAYREIPVHYGIDELETDLKTIEELNKEENKD